MCEAQRSAAGVNQATSASVWTVLASLLQEAVFRTLAYSPKQTLNAPVGCPALPPGAQSPWLCCCGG
jgi:hypothetical protein